MHSALRMGRVGSIAQLTLRRGTTGSCTVHRSSPTARSWLSASSAAAAAVVAPMRSASPLCAWPLPHLRSLSSSSSSHSPPRPPPPRSPFGDGWPLPPPPPGGLPVHDPSDPFATGGSSPNPHYEEFASDEQQQGRDPRFSRYAWIIIGANIVVYLMWHRAQQPQGQLPPGATVKSVHQLPQYARMYRHWVTSLQNLDQGRWYTLLTSAFSHQSLFHLGANMIGVSALVPGVMAAIGPRRTMLVYVCAAVTSSVAHVFYSNVVAPFVLHRQPGIAFIEGRNGILVPARSFDTPALGASGAVMAMAVIYACLYPRAKFFLMFIPVPIQARYLIPGLLVLDFAQSMQSSNKFGLGVAHWGHLGGALFGGLYYLLSVRRNRAVPPRPYIDPRHFYEMARMRSEAVRMREAWILGGRDPLTGRSLPGAPGGGGGGGGPDAPLRPIFTPRPTFPMGPPSGGAAENPLSHKQSSRYAAASRFKRTVPPPPKDFSTLARRGR